MALTLTTIPFAFESIITPSGVTITTQDGKTFITKDGQTMKLKDAIIQYEAYHYLESIKERVSSIIDSKTEFQKEVEIFNLLIEIKYLEESEAVVLDLFQN